LTRHADHTTTTLPDAPAVDGDAALDTAAAYLRALARNARDEIERQRLDAWAQHLLLLTPPPDHFTPTVERDWGGARRAGIAHIETDSARVKRDLGDLGDVIWSLVEGTARIVSEGAELDGQTAEALGRLRESVSLPVEELKRAAIHAVTTLTDILEARTAQTSTLDRTLVSRIEQLTSELTKAKREAEQDVLTGLTGRRELERELGRAISLVALTDGDPVSVLMVDLDGFKSINDTHGHAAGDLALKSVAATLTRTFPRASDVVARFGGDEFVVLLRYAREFDAAKLADRFLAKLAATAVTVPESEVQLQASVGVTRITRGDTTEGVIARADAAMYRAKRQGGQRVALYT
jgi:diguanylate cyclase (GGDEF)-like protein